MLCTINDSTQQVIDSITLFVSAASNCKCSIANITRAKHIQWRTLNYSHKQQAEHLVCGCVRACACIYEIVCVCKKKTHYQKCCRCSIFTIRVQTLNKNISECTINKKSNSEPDHRFYVYCTLTVSFENHNHNKRPAARHNIQIQRLTTRKRTNEREEQREREQLRTKQRMNSDIHTLRLLFVSG